MVRLKLTEEGIYFKGKQVGRKAVDLDTGRIVMVRWSVLLRYKDSFSMTCELVEEEEFKIYYVVDKNSGELYRFRRQDYLEAEIVEAGGEMQFAPPKSAATGHWESAEDHLIE